MERAVVENMIAPVLTDVGGKAAQARKKRHQPVAALAERRGEEVTPGPERARWIRAVEEVRRVRRIRNSWWSRAKAVPCSGM